MTPRALADVRMTLARHTFDECVELAAAAVCADGPSEARARVREALGSPTSGYAVAARPEDGSRPGTPPTALRRRQLRAASGDRGYRPVMRVTGDGGVGIEVFVEGPDDGTPVLLMHGWPDSHRLWRHQVKALSDAGFRTIAPDLRGFGDSDKPTRSRPTRSRTPSSTWSRSSTRCGVAKANVVCHDWGAVAGWGLAAFVPDRVEQLAALSVGHPKAFSRRGLRAADALALHAAVQHPGHRRGVVRPVRRRDAGEPRTARRSSPSSSGRAR